MNTDIRRELEAAVTAPWPLTETLARLRSYQEAGIPRSDVQAVLEALRKEPTDEHIEDRILELLDFVTGFCSIENTIWSDDLNPAAQGEDHSQTSH